MKAIAFISSIIFFSTIDGQAAGFLDKNAKAKEQACGLTFAQSNAIALGLSPSSFSTTPQEASSRLLATTKYRRMNDGRAVDKADIPRPVAAAVDRLSKVVIPSLEFHETKPGDILRFIASTQTMPEPDKMYSIGLIREKQGHDVGMSDSPSVALMDNLSLETTPLTFSLKRVNLMEIVERLSKALTVDVGFTQDGRIMFGRDGKWSSIEEPTYGLQFSD